MLLENAVRIFRQRNGLAFGDLRRGAEAVHNI